MTGEKRLTHAEVFEEIDWLLAADVHPELIAQTHKCGHDHEGREHDAQNRLAV